MRRTCFLCAAEVDVAERAVWSLPDLEPVELGFGTCSRCGLLLQSPSAEPEVMEAWYRDQAVYTSPGRSGDPHPRKVRGITRLLNSVEHALGRPARSVFQVGSSDGYALSRFREAGAGRVFGLDPSPASATLARARYSVETAVGSIEDTGELPDCEVWLLTHVLEHLFDPLSVLSRARALGPAGPEWLVVEVPLFERPLRLPPGYLSFEHLNYFGEEALVRLLARAGFEVVSLDKQYADDIYPVVALVARAATPEDREPEPGEAARMRDRLERYLDRERAAWSAIDARLTAAVREPERVFLWGGGVYASQLLANTSVASEFTLDGILDSSEQRWGSTLGRHRVLAPHEVSLAAGDCVVISSFASEEEIWRALAPERERGVNVVRLHGGTEGGR